MRRGTQTRVMTPGANRKRYLVVALGRETGKLLHMVGERKNRWLFLDLLKMINRACPAEKFVHIYAPDNYSIHTAKPWPNGP